MARVKILPPSVINKIAAGELIDRPASVVKELIENAIDARATRVDTYLEEGGRKLIRISDDGIGIDAEDLALVFKSHATSKLSCAEELFAIHSLGFRGEALPSVGAVSHAKITSKTNGAISGSEVNIKGGGLGEVKDCGTPEGTQVEVRDLFFNTPVRKKFMKTVPTEMSYISDVLTKFALSYPNIHFTLMHNGRKVFNLPPVSDIGERIETFFGNEMRKHLIPVFFREETLLLNGYIAPPFFNKTNSRMQFIFLNGRSIKDNAIYRAVSDAYQGKLMHKRYPIVFLFLTQDPSEVDVNVHPTKTEVRFRNTRTIYNAVFSGAQPLNPQVSPVSENKTEGKVDKGLENRSLWNQFPFEKTGRDSPNMFETNTENRGNRQAEKAEISFPEKNIDKRKKRYFQIHNAFIVEETEKGLNIIDQHALHEIILYHEILNRMRASQSLAQRLLIPELVELSPKDFFSVMNLKKNLEEVGVEIEEFGNNTIMIRSFPQILKHLHGKEFIESIIGISHDDDYRKSKEDVLKKIVNIMACKAAIKAGQKLDYQEIEELMEKRNNANTYTNNCPHGRPTTLHFSLDELYKHFKRK